MERSGYFIEVSEKSPKANLGKSANPGVGQSFNYCDLSRSGTAETPSFVINSRLDLLGVNFFKRPKKTNNVI